MKRGSAPRILILVNDLPFFISHRLPIAIAALNSGYDVHVAAAFDRDNDLSRSGLILHKLPLSRSGRSLRGEIKTLISIFRLFRKVKPDLVHAVTIKPVLYGGLAARLAGVPAVVSAVSGLGAIYIANGLGASLLRFFVNMVYRVALGHSNMKVIFQNPDDKQHFVSSRLVSVDKTVIIRGSGVDLDQYPFVAEPDGMCVVAMAARLLLDKGLAEFVEAAKLLHQRGVQVIMRVIGNIDPDNPASAKSHQVEQWKQSGEVEFVGFRSDIAHQYSIAHIACLPSYREGLPKSLVEAAACGRAVITTDVPGCRYVIEPEKTGVLIPVRNASALADAVERLVRDPDERRRMGAAGRELAEREFGIGGVVAAHMHIYKTLLQNVEKGLS